MKKIIISAAMIIAAFVFVGTTEINAQDRPNEPMVGAYQKAERTDAEVKAAAEAAINEQGEDFRLRKIVKAERQVVAGMNFRLRMKVAEKVGEKESKYTVIAVVYRDLEGNFSVTSWERAKK